MPVYWHPLQKDSPDFPDSGLYKGQHKSLLLPDYKPFHFHVPSYYPYFLMQANTVQPDFHLHPCHFYNKQTRCQVYPEHHSYFQYR